MRSNAPINCTANRNNVVRGDFPGFNPVADMPLFKADSLRKSSLPARHLNDVLNVHMHIIQTYLYMVNKVSCLIL